ncbi:MAG: malectin domain-containing carbohydrate-binding protein, partial [Phycisphaerae bacterium]|nr:malectin domain-containing carbohydrate-binding protein [Phycisphaerae bacterium]
SPPNARAEAILDRSNIRDGYCIVRGAGDGRLIAALAADSDLTIMAVDADAGKIQALRRRLDDAGLYGTRISLHVGDPLTFPFPPYLAALTVIEGDIAADPKALAAVFNAMRPYGGIAVLAGAGEQLGPIGSAVKQAGLSGARAEKYGNDVLLFRDGPPAGAADWTHQFGDAANTVCSKDELVKAPLGVLWFGNNSNADVLPRHGHGPSPQVVGGRMFIEGIDCLSARDIYTGRVLWKQTFDDLATFGTYYDETHKPDAVDGKYNQRHLPGANARGANFVAASDAVYVALERACVKLDPATGRTVAQFELPPPGSGQRPATWGYVAVHEDLLIATLDMMTFPRELKALPNGNGGDDDEDSSVTPFYRYDNSCSRRVVVMNRHTGKVLWSYDSELGLRHSAIAVGGGKLFCIDMLPGAMQDAMRREGGLLPAGPTLIAMDVRTGKRLWSTQQHVFGSWLGYSAEHDVLVQAGRKSRDMLWGETGDWMIAYAGKDGRTLWNESFRYEGPVMLNGRTIITQGEAYDLLTGEPKMRPHPLTGEPIRWQYGRKYGCNTVIASRNLLTFRSAAAGYYDLLGDGGTSNLGGFKSGCTSNLIVAGGLLNAPDYTRTCSCSYQNQTSLAMIHMPDLETWSFNQLPPPVGRVRRLALNLGAPGDRVAPDGTLWLDCPSVGGPSPDPTVKFELASPPESSVKKRSPAKPKIFRRHSAQVQRVGPADPPAWVVASGALGIRKMAISLYYDKPQDEPDKLAPAADDDELGEPQESLPPVPPATYTVRLHFAEMEDRAPGERVFNVSIQGKQVLTDFDVAKEAGGPRRSIVREFAGIAIGRELTLEFSPSASAPNCESLLCGVEVRLTGEAAE